MRTLSTEDFASAGHGDLMTVSVTFPSAAEMLDTFVLTLALGTNFRVSLGGITRHPHSSWMEQVARNATMQDTGYLNGCRYLLHDRDAKFCREFRETLAACGVECTPIPARSPNLNAHAERWARSIKEECLSKLILFGEKSLQRVVSNFLEHYHQERNHQGKDNLLLFPVSGPEAGSRGAICCRERLGGLLKYYSRAAQVFSPYGHGPATDISEPCRCSLSKVHSRGIQKSGRTTCEDLHEYHAGWRGGEFEQIHLLFSHVRPTTERYLGT